MAQLIKLQDFVSRYESDMFKYPSQFIRLKQQRWRHLKNAHHNQTLVHPENDQSSLKDWGIDDDKKGWQDRVFRLFKKTKEVEEKSPEPFTGTLHEVKSMFLEELFLHQLKWASSTMLEKSYGVNTYKRDSQLQFWLRDLPDNYFVMYKPVIQLNQSVVELDTIIIGPTDIYCVTMIEGEHGAVYETTDASFWMENGKEELKRQNPIQSLQRMEKVLKTICPEKERQMSIKKIVYCPSGFIEASESISFAQYVDLRNEKEWLKKMQSNSTPLKYSQLKVAERLLSQCQTTSVYRSEWESETKEKTK
ncbi:nuclease-related domain-containing protein [Aureibacillus halotolerans]|uniref:Nuclease-like protein n=1 Tax=Aureibacillus halotolerans TaxID=1508390 RepID=A0A4R6U2U3_9BACI|nr:nuclease-related domain-containing protein [Aureibacillus halotolerans]TDQ39063.1 nuclease-like protein [Aureibacillus halotolerans]